MRRGVGVTVTSGHGSLPRIFASRRGNGSNPGVIPVIPVVIRGDWFDCLALAFWREAWAGGKGEGAGLWWSGACSRAHIESHIRLKAPEAQPFGARAKLLHCNFLAQPRSVVGQLNTSEHQLRICLHCKAIFWHCFLLHVPHRGLRAWGYPGRARRLCLHNQATSAPTQPIYNVHNTSFVCVFPSHQSITYLAIIPKIFPKS